MYSYEQVDHMKAESYRKARHERSKDGLDERYREMRKQDQPPSRGG